MPASRATAFDRLAPDQRAAVGGEAVPALPTGPEAETPKVNGKRRPTATPVEDTPLPRKIADFGFDDEDPPVPGEAARAVQERGSSSRLGGAVLIGAAVLVVAVVIAFVLLRDGDDEPDTVATGDTPTATATPATTAVGTAQFALRGPAGSSSIALGQIFRAGDDTVRFAIAGQGIEPNASGERYSIWLTRQSGKPLLLGDVNEPVGKNGQLTAAGPSNADADKFPTWLQTYDSMAITLDDKGAKEPGKVILTGALPTAG
jgi:hypothetical protein